MAQLPFKHYAWAQNKSKLEFAFRRLNEKAKYDPSINVTEQSVYDEYVRQNGAVINGGIDGSEEIEEKPRAKRAPKTEPAE